VRIWKRTRATVRRLRGHAHEGDARNGHGGRPARTDPSSFSTLGEAASASSSESWAGVPSTEDSSSLNADRVPVVQWNNVSLWVDTAYETRRLLDRVCGHIKPRVVGRRPEHRRLLVAERQYLRLGVVVAVCVVPPARPSRGFPRYRSHRDGGPQLCGEWARADLEPRATVREPGSDPGSVQVLYIAGRWSYAGPDGTMSPTEHSSARL
jgi:hypothetical protein